MIWDIFDRATERRLDSVEAADRFAAVLAFVRKHKGATSEAAVRAVPTESRVAPLDPLGRGQRIDAYAKQFSSHVKKPKDELADLQDKATPQFTSAMNALAEAQMAGDQRAYDAATARLAELLEQTITYSDLLGRRRLMLEAKGGKKELPEAPAKTMSMMAFASRKDSPVLPNVPFTEAVDDILSREPVIARSFRRVGDILRRRHAFALARSASLELTKKIRDTVGRMMREGKGEVRAGEVISRLGDWSAAYGRTVYRTNLATAYSAGRFAQARDPEVSEFVGAFEFQAVQDSDARPHHRAAHGLLASTTDPIWERYSPPLGFNCRCSLRMVDRFELKERNLLHAGRVQRKEPATFRAAHPDKGFGFGRPDRRIGV